MSASFPPPPPPGAYRVPVGGYSASAGWYAVPRAAPPASPATGAVSLVAALFAAVVAPTIGGIVGFRIGEVLPTADMSALGAAGLSFLTPVRDHVLWVEIAFWSGTTFGVLAIVLGIVAAVKRRGRGLGITAIVLSVLGPALFFGALFVLFGAGAASAVAS